MKELFIACAFIAIVLISMIWAIQSLRFLNIIMRSQESFNVFYSLILMALPDLLVIILPITLFIGTIYVYNRFHADRELVSIMANGYTRWQLARPVLIMGLSVTCIIYLINVFVLPWSFKNMRDIEANLKGALPNVLVQEGVFTSFNDITIYVNKKEGRNLEGVLASIEKPEGSYVFMAKEGRLVVEDKIPHIIMVQGNRQEYTPQKNSLTVLYFDKTIINLSENIKTVGPRAKKPFEFSLTELLYDHHPNVTAAYRKRLYAEGYQRLLNPWHALVFTSIALAFLLSSPFTKGSQFHVITKATACALTIQVATISLMNYGVHHQLAIVLAYVIMIGALGACLYVLRKKDPYPIDLKRHRTK